jgi:hypothetical protein
MAKDSKKNPDKIQPKSGASGAPQKTHEKETPMASELNTLAVEETSQVSVIDDLSGGFEEFAGAGMENVTSSDVVIPRLTIIQGLSPQLLKSKPEYIPGASIGDIVDVGMGELFKDGILFLPVMYRKEYLEWAPRDTGKGLVNIHQNGAILDTCSRDEKNRPFLPNGNLISETAQFFGLNLTADRRRCYIGMASSQLKKARKWMTMATAERLKRSNGTEYQAPLFYRSYNLTTAGESNSQGDWSVWNINRGASLPELDIGVSWKELMKDASEFYRLLVAGEVVADTSSLGGEIDNSHIDDAEVAM